MFKRTIALFICFIYSFCCFAQQSEMVFINNLIAQNKLEKNEDALIKTFYTTLKKSKSNSEKRNVEIVFNTLLANLYFDKKEGASSIIDSLYKFAISKALKSNDNLIIWTNTEYGFYLYRNSLYKDALPYFVTASTLMDKSSFKLVIQPSDVFKKSGFYFGGIEDYNKSILYLKKALAITDKKDFEYGTFLNNLGNNYKNKGNTKVAENYYNATLKISQANNDEVRYAKALGDLALLYEEKGEWKKAEAYFLEDIVISKRHNSDRNTMFAQIQLGNLYYKTNKLIQALIVLNEAENYAATKSNLKGFEQQIAEIKLAIAVLQNDEKTELEQRRKLENIVAYVSNTDGEQVINRLNLEAQNENVKLQLLAEKVKAKNDSLILNLSIVIATTLLILLVLLYVLNKRKLKYQEMEFDRKLLSFQLDKKNSEAKLNKSNNSLASFKIYLTEKNEQIKQLEEEILKKENFYEKSNYQEEYKQLLNSHLLTDDNWQQFKKEFIREQKDFYENILLKHPTLTESNLRLVMLLKMGLTNPNIANLLAVTLEAVKKAKQRLKQKHIDILKELE